MTSGEFRDFFVQFIAKNGTNEQITSVGLLNWDMLFHTPGMPLHTNPDFTTNLAKASVALAEKWNLITDDQINDIEFNKSDINGWSTGQINVFIDTMILYCNNVMPFSIIKLEQLDKIYEFSKVQNAEIKFRWQCLCLKTGVTWIVPQVLDFVKSQGRMKFVRPLYRALNNCSAVNGTQIAKSTFIQNHQM